MGIFDDAIREHLELRRRQGAGDDELARLEGEAFGPPARPGDPDFPESDEVATAGGEVVDVPTAEEPIESPAAAQGIVSELPAVEEEPIPAPEPPLPEAPFDEAGSADEAEPAAESEDLELDLELDLQEELDEVGELELEEGQLGEDLADMEADEPLAGDVETPAEPDVPIETLPTVEHHFADALDEAEVVEEEPPSAPPLEEEPPSAPPAEEEPPPAPPAPEDEAPASTAAPEPGQQEAGSDDDAEKAEDVLEETPEFLRDQPEDDELWFEQREPKDFDF